MRYCPAGGRGERSASVILDQVERRAACDGRGAGVLRIKKARLPGQSPALGIAHSLGCWA